MTPLVAATSWAMEGLERQSCGMDRRAISVVAGGRNTECYTVPTIHWIDL